MTRPKPTLTNCFRSKIRSFSIFKTSTSMFISLKQKQKNLQNFWFLRITFPIFYFEGFEKLKTRNFRWNTCSAEKQHTLVTFLCHHSNKIQKGPSNFSSKFCNILDDLSKTVLVLLLLTTIAPLKIFYSPWLIASL